MAEVTVAIYAQSYVPHLLEKSLKSATGQTLGSLEIILVDDCRTATESRSLKSTFKKILKSMNLPYGKSARFLSMGRSIGVSDSLRSALEDSSGTYFTVLMMGDAFYSPKSLSILHGLSSKKNSNIHGDWDLIQGTVVADRKDVTILEKYPQAYDIIEKNKPESIVEKKSDDFASIFFLEGNHSLCLEGKLFLRSTFSAALDFMPRVECYCGFEYLLMYFFTRKARSLISVDEKVCLKDMEVSVDSGDFEIESPGRFMKICSVSSAFSAIFFDLMDRPMEKIDLSERLQSDMSRFALSNVRSLVRVDSSIKSVCQSILVECWGKEIVDRCNEWLEKNPSGVSEK